MSQELLLIMKDMSDSDQEITETMLLKEDLGFTSMKMILFLSQACKLLSINMMDLDPSIVSEIKTVEGLMSYLTNFEK